MAVSPNILKNIGTWERLSFLPEYRRGYLNGLLAAQGNLYGAYLLGDILTEAFLTDINLEFTKTFNDQLKMEKEQLEILHASEAMFRERSALLKLLAAYYQLDVYSEKTQVIEKAREHGYIDYYTQMPEIFANSKVNLNISLKVIRTGIPLRVTDVVGCGGFVLSNYQEEILEYMHPSVDYEVYESLEDAYYKVEFYLKNEKIREKIAQNGLEQMELIFVDDVWDKIKEREKQYSENIIVIHCKDNGRQGRVRNIGMSYASGDYIAIVNYELYHYFVNG